MSMLTSFSYWLYPRRQSEVQHSSPQHRSVQCFFNYFMAPIVHCKRLLLKKRFMEPQERREMLHPWRCFQQFCEPPRLQIILFPHGTSSNKASILVGKFELWSDITLELVSINLLLSLNSFICTSFSSLSWHYTHHCFCTHIFVFYFFSFSIFYSWELPCPGYCKLKISHFMCNQVSVVRSG